MEIYKPNFKQVYTVANEILLAAETIATFPFSVTKMIQEMTDINCCSFKRALRHGVDIAKLGSDSAIIAELGGMTVVFYNDNENEQRVRFSLLHELGHYILNHDKDIQDKSIYNKQEIEANCFAAQILMPEQILMELQRRGKRINQEFLIEYFNVSREAATKRIETMHKLNYEYRTKSDKEFDDWLITKYNAFVDSIIPRQKSIDWFEDEYERQRDRDRWCW